MWPLVLLLAGAPPSPAPAALPSIVLITLDTTRADRMGFLGSPLGLTPALDGLAAQAVVFEHAYAQAPITTVSHATVLSGTYPPTHGVNDFGVRLPESVPYLPELLKGRGYATAAFVGSLILDPRGGLAPGFDRGFDTYDAGYHVRHGRDDRYRSLERRGEEVVARAIAWLEAKARPPFFLWVHLYDAHDPYDPPEPYKARFHDRPYDGEITAVDAAVGRLLSALRARGLLEDAILAVAADHGESLGAHGEKTHGVFLYEETLHVPLLVKLPKGRQAGRRTAVRASLADLAPTLLAAAALPVPAAMQGESLLRYLDDPRPPDRPSYAETAYPQRAFGWSPLASWRADRLLFVEAPRRELYDLVADPGAARDLSDARAQAADRMAQQLQAFRRGLGGGPSAAAPDSELQEKLAALGYVSGAGGAAPAGADPKDKIAAANVLHDAIVAVDNAEYERAVPLLERVIASDPQIPMAQLQLGLALCRSRQYARAVPVLRKAIERRPDSMRAHYELGLALFETGDLRTAAGHFEIVASRMPQWADARFSFGSVLARIDRVPEALRELEAALALEPGHYRANLLLGRLLDLTGRASEGLPHLEQAVRAQPGSAEAHAFLADAYDRLGRVADAARERGLARRP